MEKRERPRRKLPAFESEAGYLMLSTLFLLMLTGILLQSVIKISTNHIIQLNQVSSAYQAKTALNMSEKILRDYILENHYEQPEKVELSSSIGNIRIEKNSSGEYEAVVIHNNGMQFVQKIAVEAFENLSEETEDSTELLSKESLTPNQQENIISD